MTTKRLERTRESSHGIWILGCILIGIITGTIFKTVGFLLFLFVGIPLFWFFVVSRTYGEGRDPEKPVSKPDLIIRLLITIIFLAAGFILFTIL